MATKLRLFYLLYFGGIGIALPFFAPYLRGLGFSGREIGTVQMIAALGAAPAAMVWAIAADRLGAATLVLKLATGGALAAALALPWVRTPFSVGAVLLLQGLALPAIIPLIDGLAVESVRDDPRTSYSKLRLYGSVGYIVSALLMGALLTARGDRVGDIVVPLGILVCTLGYAITARTLPPLRPPDARPNAADMLALLKNRQLLLLMIAGALHSACTAPYFQLFGVLVRESGLPSAVTGTGMTVGVLAEIVALYAFNRFEQRFAMGTLLAMAFAAGSLRWFLLSMSTSAAVMIALQTLHAFTFGVYWGATIKVMTKLVPSPLRTTGQALFGAIVFSLGGALGSQLSGLAYDHYAAAAPVYRWAAAGELLPFLCALLLRARGL